MFIKKNKFALKLKPTHKDLKSDAILRDAKNSKHFVKQINIETAHLCS